MFMLLEYMHIMNDKAIDESTFSMYMRTTCILHFIVEVHKRDRLN